MNKPNTQHTEVSPKIRILAARVREYFHRLDKPPADEVIVPPHMIKPDRHDQHTFMASILYKVKWVTEKTHWVRIQFKTDPNGRFIPNSYIYI